MNTPLRAVDLFAGAGGLTVGLTQAGFQVVGAVENDGLACDTYADNHPDVQLWRQDVREVKGAEMLRALGLERGQLDLLAGCPPCQGFSSIRTLNGGRAVIEPRNDLVAEYARLVEQLLPRAVLMENVPGLAKDSRMTELVDTLEDLGYPARGAARILNAADYGVPQNRRRLVLVAARARRLERVAPVARRSTVRDAIGHLDAPGDTGDQLHDLPERRSDRVSALIRRVPADGGGRLDLDEQLACHDGFSGFKDVYGRMAWDRPAPTITGGCHNPSKGRFLHPEQHRAVTLREAALLQGFPGDYQFRLDRGKLAAAVMIGNALPPAFVAAHARPVAERLRGGLPPGSAGYGRRVTDVLTQPQTRDFHLKVMGRTLEHLGVQMYKRRDAAIAELVANCWDAGATHVDIAVPDPAGYSLDSATLTITDDGGGMSADEVEHDYLVIGRNRRSGGQSEPADRKVMGRKGIGKLAGFGLARRMQVTSWKADAATVIELDSAALKAQPDTVTDVPIRGEVGPVPPDLASSSGTRLTLRGLKHRTPLDPDMLRRALARRFSRTVRGHMQIVINGETLQEPALDLELREPTATADDPDAMQETTLPDGGAVRWWAGFSSSVLPAELQGFTVLVRGKTAQAAPFFFGVESTATAQVGTKYLTGVMEADYLDDGSDDDSDRISTDRQEVDWSDDAAAPLHTWGAELVRRLLRDRRTHREDDAERRLDQDPDLKPRIDKLDKPSRDQVRKFVRSLGGADADPGRTQVLADTVVRAYEYRQFHDYTEELDKLSDQPEQLELALEHLRGWKVLESRAILEVVRGRLDIVDKFNRLIVDDTPETAPKVGRENLHDLIADYPWLIDPEWQVMAEETGITSQLRAWGEHDLPPSDRERYDFLALEGGGETVVIEIKRSGHPVDLPDLQQIEGYVAKLAQARPAIRGAFITGDRYALPERTLAAWKDRDDIELLTWGQVYDRTRTYYEHYRAVLEGDVGNTFFASKTQEVARTRQVLRSGAYRGPARRKEGLGPQDSTPRE